MSGMKEWADRWARMQQAQAVTMTQGIGLSAQNQMAQPNSVSPLPRYIGADYETVDDGSAAHEPTPEDYYPRKILRCRLAAKDARIAALEAENANLRALLSRVEDAPTDPVQSDIERTIDHLLNGRTTKDQRKGLNTATERAERVTPNADAAVGRALR